MELWAGKVHLEKQYGELLENELYGEENDVDSLVKDLGMEQVRLQDTITDLQEQLVSLRHEERRCVALELVMLDEDRRNSLSFVLVSCILKIFEQIYSLTMAMMRWEEAVTTMGWEEAAARRTGTISLGNEKAEEYE